MPVITYVAVDRGLLAAGHSESTQYQIEVDFEAFPFTLNPQGELEYTYDGSAEGYLYALRQEWTIQSELVLLADREDWREFMSSVINGETFQIDFTGTIAAPGTDIDVTVIDRQIREQQIRGIGVKYSFTVRATP